MYKSCDRPAIWAIIGLFATLTLLGFPSLEFGKPIVLGGDHFYALKVAREAIDGVYRFNPKLGAPAVHDNLYLPFFDFSYKALSWIISWFTSNIFMVIAFLYLVGVTLNFAFAFWAFLTLGIPAILSSIAAVAFVASHYFVVRSFAHDYLSLYFSVPLGAALPLILVLSHNRSDLMRRVRTPFFITAVLMAGTSGIYYGLFTGLFAGVGLAMIAAERRQWAPIVIAAGVITAIVALLFATTYGTSIASVLNGTVPHVPDRGGAPSQLVLGLLLTNAMWDYFNIGLGSGQFAKYLVASGTPSAARFFFANSPEWPGVLITTIILASVAFSPVVAFAARVRSGRTHRLVTMSVLLIAFGVVFSLRGGLGYVFNFMVMSGLRAQDRILPFLSFYALVIVCVSIQALAAKRFILASIVTVATVALLAVGLLPPRIPVKPGVVGVVSAKQKSTLSGPAQANYDSVLAMLTAKDAVGLGVVLQLPFVVWPEQPPTRSFEINQHFLPYLLDRSGSPTRWSYGMSWWQQEFHQVLAIATADNAVLPSDAAAKGYDGILIEKAAYSDVDLASLEGNILRAGDTCAAFNDARRELFAIGKPCAK